MLAKGKSIVLLLLVLLVLSMSSCKKQPLQKDPDNKSNDIGNNSQEEAKKEEDKKEEDKKEEDNGNQEKDKTPIIEKTIDYSKFKTGQLLHINKDFLVYKTAKEAEARGSSDITYTAGDYYVYGVTSKAINLSKTSKTPGGWVDLNVVGEGNIKISKKAELEPPKTNDYSQASTKAYSWSWAYPESSGKSVLESNNGVYKRYNIGKTIYLTFDNGYEYENLTDSILNILADHKIKAVFFVTGSYIKNNPKLVLKMVEGGHIVGNHSENHKNHAQVSITETKNDLLEWEASFQKLTASKPKVKLYRPPSGSFSETSLLIAKDLGYTSVLWSYAYHDWDPNNQPEVGPSLDKLHDNSKPGSIILLHAVSRTNVDLLSDYIEASLAEGYQFKLLD